MDKNVILNGECLEVLKTLPDNSINCCITSPPYYGLRDYGTGSWVGGDPNCDHASAKILTRFDYDLSDVQKNNQGSDVKRYRSVCPTCGAVREDKQVGLEDTPEAYINKLVAIFTEVRRVLTDDGTLWINIGDTYNGAKQGNTEYRKRPELSDVNSDFVKPLWGGAKPKDLIGIPWMLAFALRNDGWYLRQDIIWQKPNPMPESVRDRCTKAHEYIFLLTKRPNYYFDSDAIRERGVMVQGDSAGSVQRDTRETHGVGGGNSGINLAKEKLAQELEENGFSTRNKRDVWSVVPSHYKEAHFATFPEELVKPMVLAGCPKGGIVLDPFMGSGTTAVVAKSNYRNYVGIELNPEYIKMAENRIANTCVSIQLFDIDSSNSPEL